MDKIIKDVQNNKFVWNQITNVVEIELHFLLIRDVNEKIYKIVKQNILETT